jgi:hypothetical protein
MAVMNSGIIIGTVLNGLDGLLYALLVQSH